MRMKMILIMKDSRIKEVMGIYMWIKIYVTNFIWPYLHQFFNDSHSLNGYRKPLKRPFNRCQSHLEAINIG